jgi:hypothetical protein
MKDWKGNSVSYITTNGFSNNNNHDREVNDYYATDPKAVELLLDIEDFSGGVIWECACGEGHLSNAMINKGYEVYSSDIINRGYGDVFDFLDKKNIEWNGHIITNPPYKNANDFIEKSLNIIPDGYKIALFLPIRYLEGKKRKTLFTKYPPKIIYVSSSRIKCAINGEFDKVKSSAVSYSWIVWEKGYCKDTIIKWFN